MSNGTESRQLHINFALKGDDMNENEHVKQLCLALMNAETQNEVVTLLRKAGYWDDERNWRFYGDYENNYNTIGNQQSSPDAALVEKLVNAVDARLMNECLANGVDPESSAAPQGIQDAVAQFFEEGTNPNRATAGLIREWGDAKRTSVARGITLAVTGFKANQGDPNFTISDLGEGQTPDNMPSTFLSLTKSNKLRIPFVQGKFNMGGTGVLKFCGEHGLQLIVSKRNPAIRNNNLKHPSDHQWGFTIVRREYPTGNRRSSVYTYLAPLKAEQNPRQGGILRFDADKMPIFPDGQAPYARDAQHGTLIKLYEYATKSRTHMFLDRGLKRPLDLLLTDLALPIRLHECRDYQGHAGSFETTLTGIKVRLEDDKATNLEIGFPSSSSLRVMGEQMTATIYAFKKGKSRPYRRNEGIIFTVNGQTHGHLTADFFRRKNVGLGYLKEDILVIIDCTKLAGKAREDLFMNSRDRLSDGALRSAIEDELEDLLKRHSGLRELKEKRRREELESKLDDSKPLENILEDILQHSPTLSDLFLKGTRISTPFKTQAVQENERPFDGKRYPTYFKFKGQDYGTELTKNCHINMRCRIKFETDAANDYFDRDIDPGEFSLYMVSGNLKSLVEGRTVNLHNGVATLSFRLPENCRVDDKLHFLALVNDRTQIDAFENHFVVTVVDPNAPKGGATTSVQPPGKKPGKDREMPAGIVLPNIIPVYEQEWDQKDPPFDQYTALRIIHAGTSDEDEENGNGQNVYDFYVNMDNAFLKHELKRGKQEIELAKAQFKYGLVLLGLGVLHEDTKSNGATNGKYDDTSNEASTEDKVETLTRAVAPILLPMIESLGTLKLDEDYV